ncbi:Myocos [Phodopus roborovskii]|uniref:Myocos protein n=1 Tax=Phodopus roborovskii TaxID=109678 RepID=A0AAU9Z9W4_PHORO|nr:Myocos [Phodopus roborovskii]
MHWCGSSYMSAGLGFRGLPQKSWMEKIFDLLYMDLVSEVDRRRTAMATRDETITKKTGEGRETPPTVDVKLEPHSKINLRVPPAPPPSPADATDISKPYSLLSNVTIWGSHISPWGGQFTFKLAPH